MTILLLVAFAGLLFSMRQPIFLVLGAVIGTLYLGADGASSPVDILTDMYAALDHQILVAVPLFVWASNIMSAGSIARRMIAVATELTSFVNGGLGLAAVVAGAFFAAISGSSVVTLLAVGSVLYPSLVKAGYGKPLALGVLSSAGTLGVIIPPSIPLILYGFVTQTSVPDLFLAGILPGLVLVGALAVYVLWTCRSMPRSPASFARLRTVLREGVLAMAMPLLVLGGIYSGIVTATEAAGIAVVYALIVEGLVYRKIGLKGIIAAGRETIVLVGVLIPILAFAVALNQYLAFQGYPQQLAAAIAGISSSKVVFLMIVLVVLLIAGCIMDMTPAIILLAPLLAPVAATNGIHPVHFGIIMVVALEIGYITPPMGLNLFVASSAFREPVGAVIRACVPFVFVMLLALILIAFIPQISLLFVSGPR